MTTALDFETAVDEWNAIAAFRARQLRSDDDLTYFHVLVPTIQKLLTGVESLEVLDAGCGVGALIPFLLQGGAKVTAIDPSGASIEEARALNSGKPVDFFAEAMEWHATSSSFQKYDAVVANMVLMNTPDLKSFLTAVFQVLAPGGVFVATLTHPAFWPLYKGYLDEPWFNYGSEVSVRAPFTISLSATAPFSTTHVHRPLQQYGQALRDARLTVEQVLEPMPDSQTMQCYPKPWRFPRYIGFRARKPSLDSA